MDGEKRISEYNIRAALAAEHKVPESEVVVSSYELTQGSKKGDGFTCTIYILKGSALISTKCQNFNYIAKVIPENPLRENFVRASKIMETEITAYTTILPELQSYSQKAPILNLKYPIVYYTSNEEGILIMENLKVKGFDTRNTKSGIVGKDVERVLEQLAQLHAASYYYLNSLVDFSSFKNLSCEMYRDTNFVKIKEFDGSFSTMMNNILEGVFGILRNEKRNEYADRLQDFRQKNPSVLNIIDKIHQPSEKQFNVLIHGDIWINNIMFDTKDNISLIDLQMMRVSRPSLDIVYFLCTSTNVNERKDSMSSWLTFYHEALIRYSRPLTPEIETLYPYSAFLSDVNESWFYGYVIGCMMSQITLTDEAKKEGGFMDMDQYSNKSEMADFIENTGNTFIQNAAKHDIVTKRILDLTEECIQRNIF